MNIRVNITIPQNLLEKSQELVKNGYFGSFSELVRGGLRKEIGEYENKMLLSDDEKNLFKLIREADRSGLLLSEEEMAKHGLKV